MTTLGFYLFVLSLFIGSGLSQQRRSNKASQASSTSASQVVDFDCPEEFGYYPHPADCTQYYVCVFGGALLESCTGGLMYSHELQTCDWPRNVGCGELVSTVSSVKAPEPRPRQPPQLRPSQQQPQLRPSQQQPQQDQQQPPPHQQFPPQRPLQRDEAIPKHHLYTEEDLGPAEEVESDRQQRVYRGQPATLGQVARDRDGLARHSNALQVAPGNGREKLSVISFGTQQQYSRQSIAPPPYIEQTTTRVTVRAYNTTQQQYTPSPYDPYYNIYEDEADLYKDIDYSQYTGQQNQQYQKQSPVVQQQVQATPSRKPTVQYSPPPPQQSYNAVQQDVYSQAQDYNDNYNLQDEDIDYKQADLDIKGNRSRTTKRQEAPKSSAGVEKDNGYRSPQNPSRNRHLTLTAAFSFEDENSPVTSSKKLEENLRQRSSLNSFQVEDPPSSGPLRDSHELVLSYIRQENPAVTRKNPNEQKTILETNSQIDSIKTLDNENQPKNHPKPYLHDLDTSQVSSTSPPKRNAKIVINDRSQTTRAFRIIVPSSTANPVSRSKPDQVTLRPRYTIRRGNSQQNDNSERITSSVETSTEAIRPYKLPALTKESIEPLPVQYTSQDPVKNSGEIQPKIGEEQTNTNTRRRLSNENKFYENRELSKSLSDINTDSIKLIPITPQRTLSKNDFSEFSRTQRVQNRSRDTTNPSNVNYKHQAQLNTEIHEPQSPKQETYLSESQSLTRKRHPSSQQENKQNPPVVPTTEESIFKFVPIQPVRTRPNQNDEYLSKHLQSDVTTNTVLPRRLKENAYQVTEESSELENNTPLYHATKRKHQSQPVEEPVNERKFNLLKSAEVLIKEGKKDSNDFGSTIRTPVRFSQTTEKTVPRPVYSLRIDNESRGRVDGVVLATLETVTLPPRNVDNNLNNNVPIARKISLNERNHDVETNQEANSGLEDKNEQQYYQNAAGNTYNNQFRFRNQDRFSSRHSNGESDYNVRLPVGDLTVVNNQNERETTPRARIIKPKVHKIVQTSTETTPSNDNNEFQKTQVEREETYIKTNLNPIQESSTNKPINTNSNIEVNTNADFEENFKYNQRRRRLNNRNRLELVNEEQGNDQINEDALFNSEEYIGPSIKETEDKQVKSYRGNTDLTFDAEFIPRKIKTLHSTAATSDVETFTEEYNTDSFSEITEERDQNVRKMHIRKKIRKTTIQQPQSTTQNYDFDDSHSSTSKLPLNPDENIQNRPAELKDTRTVKLEARTNAFNRLGDSPTSRNRESANERHDHWRVSQDQYRGRGYSLFEPTENTILKSSRPTLATVTVDPYKLLKTSTSINDLKPNKSSAYEQLHSQTQSPVNSKNTGTETKTDVVSKSIYPLAVEINSYFKETAQNSTNLSTNNTNTTVSTTPYPMTTVERIRDKFRLGNFPKPTPSSNTFARKPSIEDSTPPPLPSDRCSQELDNESECNEKPLLRVRPTPASPDSQATPGLTRGNSRGRGSATYTVSPNEAERTPVNRGTPSVSRNRPTLKPSTSVVSKASEYIDIYRYPPSRPEPIYPTPQVDKTAAKCRKDVCLLPDCSCGGKEIPGDLPPEQTPQIVLLTFDDSVNDLNKGLYSDLFEKGRTNPNGCPIAATFYVSHEWTDYSQVQNLYAGGHEIASHSVSHSFGEQFSVKKWTREIAGQREILSAYGGVRQEDIRGMRAPFLAIGGNKMFKMLYDSNFTYDSSMPVYENKPPSWPYTLDYKIFHDCMIPPCPTRSYPGVWEVPMVMWQDLNGGRCSMGDACSNPPTADGVYKMLVKNFERHFTSNRSPFGLFYHAAWFTQPHHKEGFIAFIDTITKMPEVWLLTNWQAVQWVRDPTPISRLNSFGPFQCNYPERPRRCNNPKVCNLWHKSGVRYMRTCQPCPEIYPWTGKTGVRNSRVDNEIITE